MLTKEILIKMKLFYDKTISSEVNTSDPSYPIVFHRFIGGFEKYRAKNSAGSTPEKCKLIITDWSIQNDQELFDHNILLTDLLEYGFEIYVWTGSLEKITTFNELLSKRKRIYAVDSRVVKEALTQWDKPLLPKECVFLDYFKIRELIAISEGDNPQNIPLDVEDVNDYLPDILEPNQALSRIEQLISSLAGRDTVNIDFFSYDAENEYVGLFIIHLLGFFPDKIRIKNISSRESYKESPLIDNSTVQQCIESIKFQLRNSNEENFLEDNIRDFAQLVHLKNLQSIHIIYETGPHPREAELLRHYENWVHTFEITGSEDTIRSSLLSLHRFHCPNLHQLIFQKTHISEEQFIGFFLLHHQKLKKLAIKENRNHLTKALFDRLGSRPLQQLTLQLEQLEIEDPEFIMTGEYCSVLLSRFTALTHLTLKKLQFDDHTFLFQELSGYAGNNCVNTLILEDVVMSALQLSQLVQLFPGLKNLTIKSSTIKGDAADDLFAGNCLSAVEMFTANHVNISQKVIEKLMKQFKVLRTLSLDDRHSGSRSASSGYIVSLAMIYSISTQHLRSVEIDFTKISYDNLFELCFANKNLLRLMGGKDSLYPAASILQYTLTLPELLNDRKHLQTNIMTLFFPEASLLSVDDHMPIEYQLNPKSAENLSESPRDVIQFIAPKDNTIHPLPDFYRERPFLITSIENGKVAIDEYEPDDIVPYFDYEIITSARQLYESNYANEKHVYLAEREYILRNNEWRGLTSYSCFEILKYMESEVALDVGFSKRLNKYFVRLRDPVERKKVFIRHIFYAYPMQQFQKIFDTQADADIHSLSFDNNGLYLPNESNRMAYERLMSLEPLLRVCSLLTFYDGHSGDPQSGFKAGTLQGEFNNDIDVMNAVKGQKIGGCLLKAIALGLDLKLLNVPDFIVWRNGIHVFLEVNIDGTTYTLDQGGIPLNLNLLAPVPSQTAEEEPHQNLDIPNPPILFKPVPQLHENNPFITWKKDLKNQQNTLDEYINSLMLKAGNLPDKQRNIMVICDNSSQQELFNARLARYTRLVKKHKYYYLADYDQYSPVTTKITPESYKEIPSQIVDLLNNCNKGDVLCVNLNNIGPHYLWFLRLAEGYIGAQRIPPELRVIMVIDRDSLPVIGSEFYNRLKRDLIEYMPFMPEGDLYNNCVREYVYEDMTPFCLFENSNAPEILKGEIHINGEVITFGEGTLMEAILSESSGLVIQNAPFHLKSFREFLITLLNTGQLFHNGELYTIPQPFTIHHYITPYTFNGNYSITPLGEENRFAWSYSLNHTTWSSFFKKYQHDPKTQFLHEDLGWLADYKGTKLTILITEEFPPNAWAEFLDHAHKNGVTLELIVPDDITLPKEMYTKAQINFYADKGKEKNRQNNAMTLILTNDVDFTFEHQFFHAEDDVVYHVTEASKYSELFEHLSPIDKTLRFELKTGYILQQLFAGKRVVLKGRISKEFAQHLESLFSQRPHLHVNKPSGSLDGSLVFITDDKQLFPYFNAESFQVNKEDYWDKLQDLFSEHKLNVEQLRRACEAIFLETGIDFNYIQLKKMMENLVRNPHFNPLLPYLRIFKNPAGAIEISKRYFSQQRGMFAALEKSKDRRLAKLCYSLAYSNYAFIIGESGTAKTTLIRTQLLHFMKEYMGIEHIKIHDGIANIAAFIEEGGILYIDEANLKEEGAYDMLENLVLNDTHRIIFSGNFSHYADRKLHKFFLRHGNVVLFKELRDDYLLEDVLKPVFTSLFPEQSEQMAELNDRIMLHLLNEYKRINALFVNPPFTPRNLQMIVLRSVANARFIPKDQVDFSLLIALAINDELNGCTKSKEREGIPVWSAEQWERLKAYETYLNNSLDFKSSNYVLVPSRRNTLRLIYDLLRIRLINKNQGLGITGFLQEGGTNNGKSNIIIEALKYQGFVDGDIEPDSTKPHYYHITSSDEKETLRIFTKAFHEGAPLIIDELNTLPFIEECLNAFMSGFDLEGNPPNNPGFIVFASQNPVQYVNRNVLSPAVHKRFTEDDTPDYTREELISIGIGMGYMPALVEHLVDQFLYAINLANLEDVAQRPALNNLLHVLEHSQPLGAHQSYEQSRGLMFSPTGQKRKHSDDECLENEKGKEKVERKKQKPEKEKEKEKEKEDEGSAMEEEDIDYLSVFRKLL